MVAPALFKFVNWITGTPVPIDDAMTSALTTVVNSALSTALLAFINNNISSINIPQQSKIKAILEDNKTTGTDGGTFTTGALRTRALNTEVYDPDNIVSLSANQFILIPGSWYINWSAPAFTVARHKTQLQDITNAATVKLGSSEYANNATPAQTRSVGSVVVSVSATTTYEIQHICEVTQAANGLGVSGGFSTEVYTRVEIYSVT